MNADGLVTWKAPKAQFGTSDKELCHSKSKWPKALQPASAAYRDAEVEVAGGGVVSKPSRPPVAPQPITHR